VFMLLRIEIHPGFLLGDGFVWYSHPTAAIRSQGGLDEYHAASPHRCRLADRKKPNGLGGAARSELGR
jgi:hypothetical protein